MARNDSWKDQPRAPAGQDNGGQWIAVGTFPSRTEAKEFQDRIQKQLGVETLRTRNPAGVTVRVGRDDHAKHFSELYTHTGIEVAVRPNQSGASIFRYKVPKGVNRVFSRGVTTQPAKPERMSRARRLARANTTWAPRR